MQLFITILQIISGLLTIILIFLQTQGSVESNSNLLSTAGFQKRGWERITFIFTIIIIALFLILTVIQTLI